MSHTETICQYDQHVHSSFSIDSKAAMNDMCIQAQKMGLKGIVFTEHVDLVPHDHQYGFFRPKEYLAEIDRNRRIFDNNLQVFAGIELGEIHRYRAQVQKIIDQENYDVIVGSLHWINDVLFYDPEFVRHRSAESVYLEYMEELCELCWTGGFDVLAHFDVVKRVLPKNHSVAAWPRVVEYMRDALRGMVKNQIALEINTWTVRNGMSETSAPGWLVSEFRRMGGEMVTFGSDAHYVNHIGSYYPDALNAARQAGFTEWTIFKRREPMSIPFA